MKVTTFLYLITSYEGETEAIKGRFAVARIAPWSAKQNTARDIGFCLSVVSRFADWDLSKVIDHQIVSCSCAASPFPANGDAAFFGYRRVGAVVARPARILNSFGSSGRGRRGRWGIYRRGHAHRNGATSHGARFPISPACESCLAG